MIFDNAVVSFFKEEWQTLLDSFDFIPKIFIRYGTALYDQYQELFYVIGGLLFIGLVYVLKKRPRGDTPWKLAAATAFIVTAAFMVWLGIQKYNYNGLFGIIEKFITWFVATFTVFFIYFSLGGIIDGIDMLFSKFSLIPMVLYFPVCMGTAVLVGHYIGIPIFRYLTTLVIEDFFQKEFIPVCIRAATYAGFLSYCVGIFETARLRNWWWLLLTTTLLSIIACFYPLGIAMLLVIFPVGWFLDKMGASIERMDPDEKVAFFGTSAVLTPDEAYRLDSMLAAGEISSGRYNRMKEKIGKFGAKTETDRKIMKRR